MPITKVFRHNSNGSMAIATFGRDHISDCATGALIRLSERDFIMRGADIIERQLCEFYERDATIPSELYQDMPGPERERFLREHNAMTISWKVGASIVKIYAGRRLDFIQEAPYPLISPLFQETVIRILQETK